MNSLSVPFVSIIIPAYNASGTISKTIEACLSQSYDKREIIVIDDGSSDKTQEIVSGYPVKLIRQDNAGPAKARNTGWKAAAGEIVVFTDSDCVPRADWLEKLIFLFDSPEIGAAGGTYGIENPNSLVALAIHSEIQYRHSSLPEYVRYLGSFSLGIKKNILEELGGFDESFRIACGEDADLTYRIVNLGYKMRFSRDCVVGHYFPTRLFGFVRQQFWRGYWIMKLLAKHPAKLGKDDYSKTRDSIQPPLFALILALTPLIFIESVLIVWVILNAVALYLQVTVASYAVKSTGNRRLYILIWMLYLRGFAWALGSLAGILKFKPFTNRLPS